MQTNCHPHPFKWHNSPKLLLNFARRGCDIIGRIFKKPIRVNLVVLIILLSCYFPVFADEVRVAVAANFIAPIQEIAPGFEQATGHKIVPIFGSTGKFYAQIKNGAPFDVLLSADVTTPDRLASEGAAIAGSRFTYAIGKLVLWSSQARFVDDGGKVLLSANFEHLALVNPKLAPYGVAAVETMKALGVYDKLQTKIVLAENLTQAQQYIASGNAALGFIALSQIYRNGKFVEGSAWMVPAKLYSPIRQDAIVLKQGQGKPAVEALMKYLKSDKAKHIIRSFGYDM